MKKHHVRWIAEAVYLAWIIWNIITESDKDVWWILLTVAVFVGLMIEWSMQITRQGREQNEKHKARLNDLELGLVEPANEWEKKYQHNQWASAGILEPDQATPWSDLQHKRLVHERECGEFNERERRQIRERLGLLPAESELS